MLQSEKEMTQNDGILLAHATQGLGYQTAGAFQRLGRRLTSFLPSVEAAERLRHVPLQTWVWDWAHEAPFQPPSFVNELGPNLATLIFTPPELSHNKAVSDAALERMLALSEKLGSLNPSLHTIWVLPRRTPAAQLARLRGPRTTIFLVPLLFSFRDAGLLDWGLTSLRKNPAWLNSGKVPDHALEIAAASDVAGFLVSSPQNTKIFDQLIEVPSLKTSLRDFYQHFAEAFEAQPALKQKVAAWWHTPTPPYLDPVEPDLEARPPTRLAQELFPSPVTPLVRNLKKTAAHYRRDPERELYFLPGQI